MQIRDIRAVLLETKSFKLDHEGLIAQTEAHFARWDVYKTTTKALSRNRFEMRPDILPVGGISFVKHALRLLGKELPEHNPYPDCLRDMLYREVKRLPKLRDAKAIIDSGKELFVKSATHKRFTGFVATHSADLRFSGASNSTPVWISEPVTILSEWRAYVANGRILSIAKAPCELPHHLRFFKNVEPDVRVIHEAVARLTEAGAPAGYVIDFGVLRTGQTALIEMNDGFSFGVYSALKPMDYLSLVANRWLELVR
jgi:hypothetical protein